MSARTSEVGLVLGGESRVDLLPPEVLQRAAARGTRRLLVGAVILTALVVAGGSAFGVLVAGTSATSAATEQARSSDLIAKQEQFSEVRTVDGELDVIAAAQAVSTSTELDWSEFYPELTKRLPAGAVLTGLAFDSASPMEQLAQASAPLQGARVFSVVMDVESTSVVDTTAWLNQLSTMKGFVDATPNSTSRSDDSDTYDVTMTLHLDTDAYWNRFAPVSQPEEVEKTNTTGGESQ